MGSSRPAQGSAAATFPPPERTGAGMSLVLFLVTLTAYFLPAFSIGTTPIPLGFILAGIYTLLRVRKIPNRQFAIFTLTMIYLPVIAARNAASEGGDLRDFLYVMICIGQMLTFCMMYDLFERGYGDRLLKFMLVFGCVNLVLMIAQLFDIFGIVESFRDVWALPWELLHRDDLLYVHLDTIRDRPYGFMAGFNVASMVLYLTFRAAWVRYRSPWFWILSLLSLVISSARMLTLFFLLYELVVPLFRKGRRKNAVKILVIGGAAGGLVLFALSFLLKRFFLLAFIAETQSKGLSSSYSYTNRLASFRMALDNIDRVFLFGGIHSQDFLTLSRAIDSEAILRSMQFGWFGFVLLVLMMYYYFDRYRSYNMLFVLALMLWTSVTFTAASNFSFTPFLFLYAFVCRDAQVKAGEPPEKQGILRARVRRPRRLAGPNLAGQQY